MIIHAYRALPGIIFSPILLSVALLSVLICPSTDWMVLSMNPLLFESPTGLCSTIVCVCSPLCVFMRPISDPKAASWSLFNTTVVYPKKSRNLNPSRSDHSDMSTPFCGTGMAQHTRDFASRPTSMVALAMASSSSMSSLTSTSSLWSCLCLSPTNA